MKIIFILEFGLNYGLGHLARCSNLAQSLLNKNFKVGLITSKNLINSEQKKIVDKFLTPFNSNIWRLNKLKIKENYNYCDNFNLINEVIQNNAVIIDHYYLSKEFVNNLNTYRTIIHFKDDVYADDILDSSNNHHKTVYFLPETLVRNKYNGFKKNIYSGLDLFPLFPYYLKFKVPEFYLGNKKNIFLAPGSNQNNLFNEIIKKINNYSLKNNFNIFTPVQCNSNFINIKTIDGSQGLHNYIYYSDLVICAAGNVMLETLFFNLKPLVYCTNENQICLIDYFENNNKAFHIKNINLLSETLIINTCKENKKLLRKQTESYFCYDNLLNIILNE